MQVTTASYKKLICIFIPTYKSKKEQAGIRINDHPCGYNIVLSLGA